jgi:DNA-binding transcriptional ArsR family regulator
VIDERTWGHCLTGGRGNRVACTTAVGLKDWILVAMDKAFRALASTRRRQILDNLVAGPMSVGEIAVELQMAFSSTSEHLSILRRAGLVRQQKEGKQVIYAVAYDQINTLSGFLRRLCPDGESSPPGV